LLVLGILLWRGVRVPIGRLLLLLTMLMLAFMQLRHQSWFAIVAAVIIPPLLGKPAAADAKAERKSLIVLAGAIPLLLARALWPLTPPESVSNPRGLLAHVPAGLRGQPVFNEYSFGGPLILAGIRPYIDGRSEMYGDAFMTDYTAIADGDMDRFGRAVARYGIRWAILPREFKLTDKLTASPGWRQVYADRVGVILVRTAAASGSAARSGTRAASPPRAAPAPPRA
jgi:hypothetical protein